jgi:hypothetical protein
LAVLEDSDQLDFDPKSGVASDDEEFYQFVVVGDLAVLCQRYLLVINIEILGVVVGVGLKDAEVLEQCGVQVFLDDYEQLCLRDLPIDFIIFRRHVHAKIIII